MIFALDKAKASERKPGKMLKRPLGLSNHETTEMSVQQTAGGIARAFVSAFQAYFADEPTGN